MSAGAYAYSQIIPVEIGDVIKPSGGCNQVATPSLALFSPLTSSGIFGPYLPAPSGSSACSPMAGGAGRARRSAMELRREKRRQETDCVEMTKPQNVKRDGTVPAFHPSHAVEVTSLSGIVRQVFSLVVSLTRAPLRTSSRAGVRERTYCFVLPSRILPTHALQRRFPA